MKKQGDVLLLFSQDQERAFKLLYDTYYESLALYANYLVGDPDVARDIVQEFFVSFWFKKKYENDIVNFKQYVYQSIRLSCLNYNRDKKRRELRHQEATEISREEVSFEFDEEIDKYEALYKAINLLPEDRRRVFMMVYTEGLKHQQVADILNISITTVRTQLQRSIKQLRNTLSDKYIQLLFFFIKRNIFRLSSLF